MRYMTLTLALLATSAIAQDADEAMIAAMTTAIEDAGCVVTADNGDEVAEASGLNEEDTIAVIAALYDDGLVALQADGTMKLTSANCP